MNLRELLDQITPPDENARAQAWNWAACAKPLESLGLWKRHWRTLPRSPELRRSSFLPGSAGVVRGQRRGGAGRHADGQQCDRHCGAIWPRGALPCAAWRQWPDAMWCRWTWGILDFPRCPACWNGAWGNGTADITCGPAMTRAQAEQAVPDRSDPCAAVCRAGRAVACHRGNGHRKHHHFQRGGQCALGRSPAEMTGRGAGLSDAGLARKIAAIERAIARNRPDASDAAGCNGQGGRI